MKSSEYYKHLVDLRVRALVDDGYEVVFTTTVMRGSDVIKLRHRSNGNIITMFVDYALCTMRQFSNHNLVYDGDISA